MHARAFFFARKSKFICKFENLNSIKKRISNLRFCGSEPRFWHIFFWNRNRSQNRSRNHVFAVPEPEPPHLWHSPLHLHCVWGLGGLWGTSSATLIINYLQRPSIEALSCCLSVLVNKFWSWIEHAQISSWLFWMILSTNHCICTAFRALGDLFCVLNY